jgi:hypothetical protein
MVIEAVMPPGYALRSPGIAGKTVDLLRQRGAVE